MTDTALELPSAGKHGSGSGSKFGWKVEYRTSYPGPNNINGLLIDAYWRTLHIQSATVPEIGQVPVKKWDRHMLDHAGLLPFVAAQAHRANLIAFVEAVATPGGALCLETRLVKCEYQWSYKTTELGVADEQIALTQEREMKISPRTETETPV